MNPLKWWRSMKKEIDRIEKKNEIMKQHWLNNPRKISEWTPCETRLPDTKECSRFDANKDFKFYRMFNCIVKEPGFQKQTKRLYFSEDGHWYDGWKFYDPYVIKWRPLPPHMETSNNAIPKGENGRWVHQYKCTKCGKTKWGKCE